MANEAARFHPRGENGAFLPATDRRQLTELQLAFAKAYAENGGNGSEAALSAGYSPASARTISQQLLALPWVQRQLEIERRRLLAQVGLESLKVISGVLRDKDADPKLRVKAAEIGLKADRADRDAQKDPVDGKALTSMSRAEIEALIRRLDGAVDDASKPIIEGQATQVEGDNVSPPPADTTQPIDPAG